MNRFSCAVIAGALVLAGCGGKSDVKKQFSSFADFEGAKMSTMNGTYFPEIIKPLIPGVEFVIYNSTADIALAVIQGKVAAGVVDNPVARYLVAQNPDLMIFPKIVADDSYGFAVKKGSELGVKANEALQKLKNDGTLARLEDIWFSADESVKKMTELTHKSDFDGSAGTIVFAHESTSPPLAYIGNDGKSAGYEMDVARRVAYELNMNLEFMPMAFAGLLPALESGKADMVGGCMSITEERAQVIDFVGPNLLGGVTMFIRKDRFGEQK